MCVAKQIPHSLSSSSVGAACFGRHVAPTELEERMRRRALLHTSRPSGAKKLKSTVLTEREGGGDFFLGLKPPGSMPAPFQGKRIDRESE